MREILLPCVLALGLGLSACGGAPPPHAQMGTAQASVRAAEVGGAPAIPKAELYLKHARDRITVAKKLMDEEENERAQLELEQAAADAELALALAEEAKARQDAQAALTRVQQLMEQ